MKIEFVLRQPSGKMLLRTSSVRKIQTEIGYRFGAQVLLRRTRAGYDVLRVEEPNHPVRRREVVRARVERVREER